MAAQVHSTFANDAQTYISAMTLRRINRDVIVYGLGKQEKLPQRFSTTFQYTRFEKLNLPSSALSEGVTPSASSLSMNRVTATMDQWGSFVDISDVLDITLKHPIMQEAIGILGEQAAETIDRECIKVLLTNTNVFYSGSATSRATLTSTDYISTNAVKRAVADLRNGGAHPYEGRMFVGVIDPSVEMDLLEDDTFVQAASYSNILQLHNAEAGKWMSVRWMVSNLLPTIVLLDDVTSAGANTGSLSNSTTYYFKVTAVSNSLGFETKVTQEQSQATGGSDESIDLTMPSTSGFTYNVYFGATSGGTLYLYSSGNAASATVNVASVPSSGSSAPASPASGVTVHNSWILGKESFAVPELMSLQTFMTPKQASDSDPLLQRRKASWKVMFKAVICNEDYLARIESASAY